MYINLSVLDIREGHLQDALKEADEAVRLRPTLSLTHYYRGHTGEASQGYRLALEHDPRDTLSQAALNAIDLQSMMQAGLDALYRRRDLQRRSRCSRQY